MNDFTREELNTYKLNIDAIFEKARRYSDSVSDTGVGSNRKLEIRKSGMCQCADYRQCSCSIFALIKHNTQSRRTRVVLFRPGAFEETEVDSLHELDRVLGRAKLTSHGPSHSSVPVRLSRERLTEIVADVVASIPGSKADTYIEYNRNGGVNSVNQAISVDGRTVVFVSRAYDGDGDTGVSVVSSSVRSVVVRFPRSESELQAYLTAAAWDNIKFLPMN